MCTARLGMLQTAALAKCLAEPLLCVQLQIGGACYRWAQPVTMQSDESLELKNATIMVNSG